MSEGYALDFRTVREHFEVAMNHDSPLTPDGELALNAMLGTMKLKGVLTDEMISQQEGEIILSKPFLEWPPELQQKLEPYGASLAIR